MSSDLSKMGSISGLRSLDAPSKDQQAEWATGWVRQVLRRSPNLKVLASPFGSGHPWLAATMHQTGIHLTQLSTKGVDENLLKYLASYSGNERLNLGEVREDGLAEKFSPTSSPPFENPRGAYLSR
jgi:hypothetical protein